MPHVSQVHHILGTMFARIISIQQLLPISLIRHRLHRTSTLFLDGVYLIQTEESKGVAPHWIPPWEVLLQQTSNKDGVFKEDDVHKRSGHSLGISLHERCHQQDRNLELKSSSLQKQRIRLAKQKLQVSQKLLKIGMLLPKWLLWALIQPHQTLESIKGCLMAS